MERHRKRILAAIAAIATVGALVAATMIVVPARATPSKDVTTTILAKSLFDEIHVRAHAHTPDRWKAQLKTHGLSDVYVVDNKFAPGRDHRLALPSGPQPDPRRRRDRDQLPG